MVPLFSCCVGSDQLTLLGVYFDPSLSCMPLVCGLDSFYQSHHDDLILWINYSPITKRTVLIRGRGSCSRFSCYRKLLHAFLHEVFFQYLHVLQNFAWVGDLSKVFTCLDGDWYVICVVLSCVVWIWNQILDRQAVRVDLFCWLKA